MTALTIAPVQGLPELREGDDLARLIAESAELLDGDVLVVAQKAISKIEGRVVRLDDIEPSPRAREIAGEGDARRIEVILREAKRVVRTRGSLVITRRVTASSAPRTASTPRMRRSLARSSFARRSGRLGGSPPCRGERPDQQ